MTTPLSLLEPLVASTDGATSHDGPVLTRDGRFFAAAVQLTTATVTAASTSIIEAVNGTRSAVEQAPANNSTEMLLIEPHGLEIVDWKLIATYIGLGLKYFFTFFIIVGGSIPYVFQYAEIHHRRNASGFSLFVCLALCVANILRILFWFGKHFDNALLAQSIVMLFCMVLMLEISVRMNRKHTPKPQRKSLLRGDILSGFWGWHDLTSFLLALAVFTAFWSLMTYLLVENKIYVEVIGMVSLLVEASLGAPQLIRNLQRKSTQGMSIPMVLAWLAGDLAKTGYFVATGSPLQFWICAILQISIDIFILGQVFVYRKNTSAEIPFTHPAAHATID